MPVVALQFKLVPNNMMFREKVDVTVDTFLDEMKRVQDGYNRDGDASPAGTRKCIFVCACCVHYSLSVAVFCAILQCKRWTAPCSAGACDTGGNCYTRRC
jgi:hypothetical protein